MCDIYNFINDIPLIIIKITSSKIFVYLNSYSHNNFYRWFIYLILFAKNIKYQEKTLKFKKILGSKCMAVIELKCEFEEKKKPRSISFKVKFVHFFKWMIVNIKSLLLDVLELI